MLKFIFQKLKLYAKNHYICGSDISVINNKNIK